MSEISVIVCCYHPIYEKLIKTLISIENQKGVDFDIVVADDGSDQDFFAEVKTWAKEHHFTNIQYHKNEVNQGTVLNIRNAIPFCQSDYIKTISPGDFLFDEYSLAYYLEGFQKYNATIVTGKSVFFDEQYHILPTLYPQFAKSLTKKYQSRNFLAYDESFVGASLAFKKEYLSSGLEEFKGIVRLLEDKPLVNKCILENKTIYVSPKVLVWYEFGNGVTTSKTLSKSILNDLDHYFEYLSHTDNKYAKQGARIHFLNRHLNKIGKVLVLPFWEPGYFLYFLKTKLKKYPVHETDISKLHKITMLRCDK